MIVGVLLAAGAGRRFGGDKLLAALGNGQCVAAAACAALLPAVDRVLAVVRPQSTALMAVLAANGAEVVVFDGAEGGIGDSLAFAVRQSAGADGWLIALGDMPLLRIGDAQAVVAALREGAAIAVPVCAGRNGHPVGFSRAYGAELAALSGDQGARGLLKKHRRSVVEVPVNDAQAWCDIDTEADLAAVRRRLMDT